MDTQPATPRKEKLSYAVELLYELARDFRKSRPFVSEICSICATCLHEATAPSKFERAEFELPGNMRYSLGYKLSNHIPPPEGDSPVTLYVKPK